MGRTEKLTGVNDKLISVIVAPLNEKWFLQDAMESVVAQKSRRLFKYDNDLHTHRTMNGHNIQPKITVLMPAYNAKDYVKAAIDSILAQTFTNFEFIIIDDCSTDATVAKIRMVPSRILFIKMKLTSGIAATLNKGVLLAKTALIARMDADDISYPRRLEYQFEHIS